MSGHSSAAELTTKKCVPCEGGVPRLSADQADEQLQVLQGWKRLSDPDRIQKSWTVKNFMAGMAFFENIARLAESEGHHPDLHLVSYRKVTVEIWTHAIQGLSLNDFILAAKIDELPVRVQSDS